MEHFVKPKLKDETSSLLTTGNDYAEIGTFSIRGYKSKTFVLKATTNNLLFKIEYSMDGTNFYTRLTDIAVSAGAYAVKETETDTELRGHHNYCKISVKPAGAGVHGTGTYNFEGSTL